MTAPQVLTGLVCVIVRVRALSARGAGGLKVICVDRSHHFHTVHRSELCGRAVSWQRPLGLSGNLRNVANAVRELVVVAGGHDGNHHTYGNVLLRVQRGFMRPSCLKSISLIGFTISALDGCNA